MAWTAALLVCMLIAQVFCYPEEDNSYDPELFQSDMRLTAMQRLLAESGGDVSMAGEMGGSAFGSAKNANLLWLPKKIVPYTITPQLAANPEATLAIMLAMKEWMSHTCLSFVQRTVEKDYIEFFMNCSGCWSYVGRQGGKQNICLSSGCWGKGTVAHEIAHAMGFWHEQSRPDRDSFIRVVWDNIPKSKKHNFKKHSNSKIDSLGTKYDYISIMQYSKTAFGSGKVTMDPKLPGVFQLGQRVGFSDTDSIQANKLYRCEGKTTLRKIIPRKNVLTGIHDCDFDTGFCHFSQDKTDDFDFTLRIGNTPSWGTGPDADFTTRRLGAFPFIEASSPRKKGDVARLISRQFSSYYFSRCMTFHYHMMAFNKGHMGDFNVYMQQGSNDKVLLFSRKGPQGSEWIEQSLTLQSAKPYRVIFEAIRGGSYQGDIAIDDVTFKTGECRKKPPTTNPPPVNCENISSEGKYCMEWKKAGLCKGYKTDITSMCPRTCYC